MCAQSCWTLWDPMDSSPLGFSGQRIFQTGILKWVAISSSRWILHHWATWEAQGIQPFPVYERASLVAQRGKRLPAVWETWVQSLGQEDPLQKEMAAHSSILAWKIPWKEEPSRLQSMGSQRVGHNWVTSLSLVYEKMQVSGLLNHFFDMHLSYLGPVSFVFSSWVCPQRWLQGMTSRWF